MPQYWFQLFIVIWTVFLIISLCFGGYFMFKKFLKKLPKDDQSFNEKNNNI